MEFVVLNAKALEGDFVENVSGGVSIWRCARGVFKTLLNIHHTVFSRKC